MTFLPIVFRELRVAARKRSTYWIRTGAALAIIVLGTWVFLMFQREPAHELAQWLFGILTGGAVLYGLTSGVRDTADCLSGEKREGTLGLLFLTDLKGYDVVFGKLVASSINALYGVLAVLPMLAVPLLMGGITLGEFGRIALVALNSLFLSLGLGMFLSSISHSGRKASLLTLLLLLVLTGILPAIGWWVASWSRAARLDRIFLYPSPGFSYFASWEFFFKTNPDDYWWSLGVEHVMAWVSLALASLIAPRSWQDRPAGIRKLRWSERWQLWSLGDLAERKAFRGRLLDHNAFFWLAARARLKPAFVWGVLGMLACAWAWGLAKFHRDWLGIIVYLLTGVFLNIILKTWFAAEAGRQLAEDRKRGALELLLSTPMTVREILFGQLLALRRQFLGPILVVLFIGCLLMFGTMTEIGSDDERIGWRIFWLGGMVMLIADLVALYWVGLWQGLSSKNPNRAAGSSAALVLVLPGLGWAMLILLKVLSTMRGGQEPGPGFLLGSWFGLGLVADIGLSVWARNKLLTKFRQAAVQRYVSRRGFFGRLFSGPEPGHGTLSSTTTASGDR